MVINKQINLFTLCKTQLGGEGKMNDVKNKIEAGMTKVQNNISNNKSKMEDKKTIANHNRTIEEAQRKRNETLLEIGRIAYKQLRRNEIEDVEMNEKCKSIAGFDYIIYENRKLIQQINDKNQGHICECGTEISKESKFCIGCGKKVEIVVDNTEYIDCSNCEMSIPSESNFCPCCGYKVEFDFSNFEI